jgi:CRISPR-associated Csx2 family protein
MEKNVFFTVLGTGKYESTTYEYREGQKTTAYIQSAIAKLIPEKENISIDECIVFATKEAQELHAKQLMNEMNITTKIETIPTARNEQEIWEIFNIFYENIPPKCALIVDVTHAFRYMPMLVVTLLGYSKLLKETKVKGIYYGEYTKGNETNPIINLTPLYSIQEWTLATYDFLQHGNATLLSELAINQVKPLLKETKGKDINASAVKNVANKLKEFTQYIEVCRSKKLIEGEYMDISNQVETIRKKFIRIFRPLFDKIQQFFEGYSLNNLNNQKLSVAYCIKTGKIQQGATLLQEYITSNIAQLIEVDYNHKKMRETISGYMSFIADDNPHKEWKNKLQDTKKEKEILDKIDKIKNIRAIAKIAKDIGQLRNDLNHAGYNETPSKYEKIKTNLENYYKKVEDFEGKMSVEEKEVYPEDKHEFKEKFLLNFSNHKYETWGEQQKQTAIKLFGNVVDLEFPNIPPEYTEEQVAKLACEYKEKIKRDYKGCVAVHIMGEFNFTFHFINLMKKEIDCYASTTERRVEILSDNSRKLYFDFVQFRKYTT